VWQQLLALCEQRMGALEEKVEGQWQQLQDTQQLLEAGQRRDEEPTRITALQQQQPHLLAAPACSKGGS
jgi:hypothetical protein